ncbi:MAG: flagellar filament capping protein FliD [Desulforegulaceae bacterium]|nr:flagellar filament capping protein FliD [Desulforegulaceae bacterium]
MAGSISTLGIGSGLELQNILDQLKDADKIPIKQKEAKQLEFKDRIEKFDVLQSKLLKTKDVALDLSLQSTYMGRNSTLSDPSVLSANTLEGAELGNYHIKVNSLAQKSSWKSDTGLASQDSYVNDTGSAETFTYEVNGKSVSLEVASGTKLSALVSMINSDENNPGVSASIIKDGSGANPYKLLLKSDTLGEEGRITITDQLSGFNMAEETGAGGSSLDAEVEVDGVSYQRATNSIDDIISGTTLNLQKTGETSFEIVTDTSSIKDQILSFVDNLKDVLSEIKTNSNYNTETNEKGSFYNISSLRLFRSQLVNDVINPINIDGNITSMVDLGIEYTRDGEIKIDEDTLENAIENNFEDLKTFLLGDSENDVTGWADTVNERLRSATSAANGIVYIEKNSAQSMYDKLGAQILNDQGRLDKRYDIMAKQFLQLDTYMSRMNSMSSYLSQQIDAMNSANDD